MNDKSFVFVLIYVNDSNNAHDMAELEGEKAGDEINEGDAGEAEVSFEFIIIERSDVRGN